MNEFVVKRNELLAQKVIKGLEKRNMTGYWAPDKAAALKTALSGTDTEAIKSATEALTQAFYAVSEKMYQQSNPQGAQGFDPNAQAGGPQPGGPNGQNYYDADYEVVDDDNK